ncbi:hypothetical protein H072_391 [Dactylellina haptotyla CBS 200.50]|uniref:Uncharacterized protein n=1 Tax=Dactylellina haptotyla (strain CBS 200.50) TaxID=1284197 RepID=S8ARW9_DACHA|nr:hypothetical protein H072_391 [Dactylellina haptotyla CBS 200.50]
MTGSRWWHAAQAITYLVQHGLNTETRDHEGFKGTTALHAGLSLSSFAYIANHKAIEALLSLGADPNALNKRGGSRPARSIYTIDIFRLLVKKGAKVTPSVFINAIREERYDILEALPSLGANPNTRKIKERIASEVYDDDNANYCHNGDENEDNMTYEETYPIHYAARYNKPSSYNRDNVVMERNLRIKAKTVCLLLENGADLFAKYPHSTVMHHLKKVLFSQYS